MKLLKNYWNSLRLIEEQEKTIDKELKKEAKDKTFFKTFLIVLPLYLIVSNMFIFIRYFYVLVAIINIIIILNIFLYQFTYFSYLKLNKYRLTVFKTIVYGLIMSVIVWLIAYFVGGFLWKKQI